MKYLGTKSDPADIATQGDAGFAIAYPNGGSEASPANIAANSYYSVANPFPGHLVACEVQVLHGGRWSAPGWYTNQNGAIGVRANHIIATGATPTDEIVVTVGNAGPIPRSPWGGNAFKIAADVTTAVPARILVRKI